MSVFDWFRRTPRPDVSPADPPPLRRARAPGRTTAVRARRGFAAADHDRLTAGFRGSNVAIDEQLARGLRTMRGRSRQLFQDFPHAVRFGAMCRQNIVGRGIKLRAQPRSADGSIDAGDKRAVEDAWRRWGQRGVCTVDGRLSWVDVCHLVAEAIPRDGEILLRMVSGFDNEFGFALQLLEADHLDEDRNRSLADGVTIRLSVEQDRFDRPVAYHLSPRHPGAREPGEFSRAIRVPAAQILHPYVVQRPGQSRGIPWAHSVIRQASMLHGYQEAELVAARAASAKMGFIETPAGEYEADDNEDEDNQGNQLSDFEPGLIEALARGQKFEPFDPQHPTSQYGTFVKDMLRTFSAGVNVSYFTLANDHEAVNFSSSRAALLEERDHWRMLQGWFCEQVCAPVFERWLPMAVMMGQVKNGAGVPVPARILPKLRAVRWQGRGWAWVKPLEDTQAEAAMIAAGFKSSQDVVEAMTGEDYGDVLEALAEEAKMRERLGLAGAVNPAAVGVTVQPPARPGANDDEG